MRESAQSDATLIAAAHAALLEITEATTVGALLGLEESEDGVVDVLYASAMPGYPDWRWTVSVSVIDGVDLPSVLELELLPGDGSILAPDWVPWSERVTDADTAEVSDDDESDDDDDESDDDEDESDDDDDDDDADESDEDDDESDDDADDDDLEDDLQDDLDDTDDDDLDDVGFGAAAIAQPARSASVSKHQAEAVDFEDVDPTDDAVIGSSTDDAYDDIDPFAPLPGTDDDDPFAERTY